MKIFIAACLVSLLFVSMEAKNLDEEMDVTFNLFTRKNPTTPQRIIKGNEASVLKSNYDANKPTKMLTHGWTGTPDEPEFVKVFLAASDVNVLMVNWTTYSSGPEPPVLENARKVGAYLGTALDWLSSFGPLFKTLHMVGISIGSHVTGIGARSVTKGVVDYITVCDPSRRSWEDPEESINAKDATYVEIIHSENGTHGLRGPLGDTDFYPNGGISQPGCGSNTGCSHMRAFEYFLESIDNEFFQAKQCKGIEEIDAGKCSNIGTLYMGGMKPKYNKTGVYFLETNAEKPYHKN